MRRSSLRLRMVAVFGLLVVAVTLFMLQFFPARMDEQSRAATRLQAEMLAQVMATAIAPALEFDDADHATKILAWLGEIPDTRFAVVVDDHDQRFASWGQRAPELLVAGMTNDLLTARALIVGRGGARGTLFIGYSLDRLTRDRDSAFRAALTASALVLVLGLGAVALLATALVRPIERLTHIAQDITRGAKPPRITRLAGTREVVEMTGALGAMLDRLNAANHQLVEASRHAGMAEVATGVLHNVGNVLTSVNVGIELIEEHVTALPAERLRRAATLMDSAKADPGKLAAGASYLGAIADHLDKERQWLRGELTALRGHVEHVKRVISMQNRYARTGKVTEQVTLGSVVSEAIALACPAAEQHHIELTRDVPELELTLDRHRVLQILVNLIANARDSLATHEQSGAPGPFRILVEARLDRGTLELAVTDTGGGIAPDALSRVFTAGFTTKPKGHGYGLHSSALAAEQLGGELTCASAGLGQGARFALRIPVQDSQAPGPSTIGASASAFAAPGS